MKYVVGLPLAALVLVGATAFADAPGTMDAGKRDERLSTDQEAVLPENKPLERNEVVGEKRFGTNQLPRKDAIVGERRSNITVGETREKREFVTPEQRHYEVLDRKTSPWAGKESRYSTSEDAYRSRVATRFQDRIGEASPMPGGKTPVISKRTSFDRVNRFAFRKNGDQRVTVTKAGAGEEAQDISKNSAPVPGGPIGSGQPKVSITNPQASP
jgi:hypothetical protein